LPGSLERRQASARWQDGPVGKGRRKTVNVLLILNDPAYGTERSWNGLRLAGSLAKREDLDVASS
jgi:hypothetical protein